MALNEIVGILVFVGRLGHPPMVGAARFDLDFALLDPGFLIWNSAKTGLVPASVSPAIAMAETATVKAKCCSFRCSIGVFRKCSPPKKALLMIRA